MSTKTMGTTITFGTSGFAANCRSVTPDPQIVNVIDTTHLATTDTKTITPASLKEPLKLKAVFEWDETDIPPLGQALETVTVTYPDASTLAGSGTITSRTPPSADAQNEDIMLIEIEVTFSGAITLAAGT